MGVLTVLHTRHLRNGRHPNRERVVTLSAHSILVDPNYFVVTFVVLDVDDICLL